MYRFVLYLIVLVSLCSCRTNTSENLPVIKFSREEIVNARPFQEFLQDPVYIPLETLDSSMISGVASFSITPEYIWVTDKISKKMLAFEREQGKFIRPIGVIGKGPQEYGYIVNAFYELPEGKIFCQDYNGRLMQYDVSGQLEKKIPIPFYDTLGTSLPFISGYTLMNDSVFCAHYTNSSGLEAKQLVLFSPEGKVYKVFPNPNLVQGVDGFHVFGRDGLFYSWNKNTYFKESRNDTIFKITYELLEPHFLIERGEYAIPYADYYKNRTKPAIFQQSLWESEQYLYFLFSFFAKAEHNDAKLNGNYLIVYDKEAGVQKFYKVDQLDGNAPSIDSSGGYLQKGLKIELVGFFGSNFVTYLSAFDIREYFGENRAVESWKNVGEEDNPVMVFWPLP